MSKSFQSKPFHDNKHNTQRPPAPLPDTKLYSYDNFHNSFTQCPMCGMAPVRLMNQPHLTCDNGHIFYDCPVCMDTRISDVRENVFYCAQLHAYHLCAVHQYPVVGPASYHSNRCTCARNQPVKQILRTTPNNDWSSPFN